MPPAACARLPPLSAAPPLPPAPPGAPARLLFERKVPHTGVAARISGRADATEDKQVYIVFGGDRSLSCFGAPRDSMCSRGCAFGSFSRGAANRARQRCLRVVTCIGSDEGWREGAHAGAHDRPCRHQETTLLNNRLHRNTEHA